MDETSQRELGVAFRKTVAATETLTIPDTHECYCIIAPITGAAVKATLIQGGATIGAIACDTHVSSTGLDGGTAVTIYGENLVECSSVNVDTGSASVVCLIRTRD